jgi:hypothetical protein
VSGPHKFTRGDKVRFIGSGPLYGKTGVIDQRTAKTRYRFYMDEDGRGFTTHEDKLEKAK